MLGTALVATTTVGPLQLSKEIAPRKMLVDAAAQRRALIPPFEAMHEDESTFSQAVITFSNVSDQPILVSLAFFQQDGALVQDGPGFDMIISPEPHQNPTRFTMFGAQTTYDEPVVGDRSVVFTLPSRGSSTLYFRPSTVGILWPEMPPPVNFAGIATNKKGYRGFGIVEWQPSGGGDPLTPSLIVNGTVWLHQEHAATFDVNVAPLVVNGGRPF